jgi:ketosteroid isomerase-like protein
MKGVPMTHPASVRAPLSPREVFERLHRAVQDDYDMETQVALFAEDGVLEWPFAPAGMPRRIEGRETIRRVLGAAGDRARQAGRRIAGYRAVVVRETTDPEVIVAEFDLHGEVRATGDAYRLSFIQVLRVRNGQIVSMRDYFNPQAMTEALSAVQKPEPAPSGGNSA